MVVIIVVAPVVVIVIVVSLAGTGKPKFASPAPLMTVQLSANTGVASVKGVSPAKVMSPWNGGTEIAQFACAAPFMTIKLTPINRQSQLK